MPSSALAAPSAPAPDTRSPATALPDLAALQRRTVRTLAVAQLAGGAGLAATATVGGLLAVHLAGSDAVAGLPQAASIAGTAAAALPLATLMRRRGRRPGLATGWLLGALGAALVLAAVALASLPLLLAGMALSGVAQAAADASRHAAADLAVPDRRGAAIGVVVFAVAVTTALSPVLADVSGALVRPLGVLPLAGPFALAVVACAACVAADGPVPPGGALPDGGDRGGALRDGVPDDADAGAPRRPPPRPRAGGAGRLGAPGRDVRPRAADGLAGGPLGPRPGGRPRRRAAVRGRWHRDRGAAVGSRRRGGQRRPPGRRLEPGLRGRHGAAGRRR